MTLAELRDAGFDHVAVWCVGWNRLDRKRCMNRNRLALADLIDRNGPDAGLVMLARRFRCRGCRSLGAHIEPIMPIVFQGSNPARGRERLRLVSIVEAARIDAARAESPRPANAP